MGPNGISKTDVLTTTASLSESGNLETGRDEISDLTKDEVPAVNKVSNSCSSVSKLECSLVKSYPPVRVSPEPGQLIPCQEQLPLEDNLYQSEGRNLYNRQQPLECLSKRGRRRNNLDKGGPETKRQKTESDSANANESGGGGSHRELISRKAKIEAGRKNRRINKSDDDVDDDDSDDMDFSSGDGDRPPLRRNFPARTKRRPPAVSKTDPSEALGYRGKRRRTVAANLPNANIDGPGGPVKTVSKSDATELSLKSRRRPGRPAGSSRLAQSPPPEFHNDRKQVSVSDLSNAQDASTPLVAPTVVVASTLLELQLKRQDIIEGYLTSAEKFFFPPVPGGFDELFYTWIVATNIKKKHLKYSERFSEGQRRLRQEILLNRGVSKRKMFSQAAEKLQQKSFLQLEERLTCPALFGAEVVDTDTLALFSSEPEEPLRYEEKSAEKFEEETVKYDPHTNASLSRISDRSIDDVEKAKTVSHSEAKTLYPKISYRAGVNKGDSKEFKSENQRKSEELDNKGDDHDDHPQGPKRRQSKQQLSKKEDLKIDNKLSEELQTSPTTSRCIAVTDGSHSSVNDLPSSVVQSCRPHGILDSKKAGWLDSWVEQDRTNNRRSKLRQPSSTSSLSLSVHQMKSPDLKQISAGSQMLSGSYDINTPSTLSLLDYLRLPIVHMSPIVNWTPREIAIFEISLCTYGQSFGIISRCVQTKTYKECYAFYAEIFKQVSSRSSSRMNLHSEDSVLDKSLSCVQRS